MEDTKPVRETRTKKAPAVIIGTGRCPIGCGSMKARYTVSVKQLACGTCNSCNTQVFARSDRSDEVLRANIVTPAGGEPAPAVEKPPQAAVPPPPPTATPADPPAAAPPPPPPPRTFGWGLFAGRPI